MSAPESNKKGGPDAMGLGKLAHAIPPQVYKQSAATVLKTFESLVAPLTETTDGLGRLVRQTFDNWVEMRKAIGTYTLEQAVIRAKVRAEKLGEPLQPPTHPKTFLRALEEGSLETDSVVHEMWANLLASQMIDRNCHPRFVNILEQLGPDDARVLASLKAEPKGLPYFFGGSQARSGLEARWVCEVGEPEQSWNLSVTNLCQQSLASVTPVQSSSGTMLVYLTTFGKEFLGVVAPPS